MAQVAEFKTTPAQKQVSQLDQLKQVTKVVADTGDFATLKEFAPEDATTNPSLILKAAQMAGYKELVERAIADNRNSQPGGDKLLGRIMDELLVLFGTEILKVVPGRVSTETDADLAFDVQALIDKAHRFIELYERNAIPRQRVLIKLATTWEGVRAAEVLQKEGINCNMTLLFSLPQAVAAAQVNAKLISPFVGRILDWYKTKTGKDYAASEDPGVQSVREIYSYYKTFGHPTEVMGASFRNKAEVLELAGCDALTISPETARDAKPQKLQIDEKKFRWLLNENAMATEKLSEGIRLFNADAQKLEKYIAERL